MKRTTETCKQLDKAFDTLLPSSADLDSYAEEQRLREASEPEPQEIAEALDLVHQYSIKEEPSTIFLSTSDGVRFQLQALSHGNSAGRRDYALRLTYPDDSSRIYTSSEILVALQKFAGWLKE